VGDLGLAAALGFAAAFFAFGLALGFFTLDSAYLGLAAAGFAALAEAFLAAMAGDVAVCFPSVTCLMEYGSNTDLM
jgi:hypothetical protein